MTLLKNNLSRAVIPAAVLCVLGAGTAAYAENDFSGGWRLSDSSFAPAGTEMRIWGAEEHAEGRYEWRHGHIRGRVDGDRFEGVWTQETSAQRCHEERDGTHYWGRMRMRVSESGRHFRGRWTYCGRPSEDGVEFAAGRDR